MFDSKVKNGLIRVSALLLAYTPKLVKSAFRNNTFRMIFILYTNDKEIEAILSGEEARHFFGLKLDNSHDMSVVENLLDTLVASKQWLKLCLWQLYDGN